jgi:hypothetical protein
MKKRKVSWPPANIKELDIFIDRPLTEHEIELLFPNLAKLKQTLEANGCQVKMQISGFRLSVKNDGDK